MSDHIGTDDRPRDALSASYAESLNALDGVIRDLRADHRGCRSVDGCPWPIFSGFDVEDLHDRLTAAGYQVVPI
jgi:hypothetical protein